MSSTNDSKSSDPIAIRNIIENYIQSEKALVDQLYFKVCHGTTIGGFREDIWRGMFEQIVPKKFAIEQSVFIMDSQGRVSNEVDLAIFDEMYTPYIFRYGRLKFLPIEAVAVVVQCKSTSLDQKDLKAWTESIQALKTSTKSYTRTINKIIVGEDETSPTQTATRPLRILCCLNESRVNKSSDSEEPLFDFVIRANKDRQALEVETDNGKTLRDWYLALNHAGDKGDNGKASSDKIGHIRLDDYHVNGKRDAKTAPVSLLALNFQLNQLLMLINNPMLFPHRAYAEMFNDFGMRGIGG